MTSIAVVDTETTGLEPGDIVELATVLLHPEKLLYLSHLVRPTCPISFEAMAVHHITASMVVNMQPRGVIVDTHLALLVPDIFVAHNAKFDRSFLPELAGKLWICTYRCALHLWPDAPSHSNQVLRYFLNLDMSDLPAEAGQIPHRALYDAWTTARLFERMLKELGMDENAGVEKLLRLSSEPVLLKKIRFGKYAGTSFQDVPVDYLRWLIRQPQMDADVLYSARHHLNR